MVRPLRHSSLPSLRRHEVNTLCPKVKVAPVLNRIVGQVASVTMRIHHINCEDDDLLKLIDNCKSKRPKLSDYDQATQSKIKNCLIIVILLMPHNYLKRYALHDSHT